MRKLRVLNDKYEPAEIGVMFKRVNSLYTLKELTERFFSLSLPNGKRNYFNFSDRKYYTSVNKLELTSDMIDWYVDDEYSNIDLIQIELSKFLQMKAQTDDAVNGSTRILGFIKSWQYYLEGVTWEEIAENDPNIDHYDYDEPQRYFTTQSVLCIIVPKGKYYDDNDARKSLAINGLTLYYERTTTSATDVDAPFGRFYPKIQDFSYLEKIYDYLMSGKMAENHDYSPSGASILDIAYIDPITKKLYSYDDIFNGETTPPEIAPEIIGELNTKYQKLKNNVIIPQLFIISEPSGLGGNFEVLEIEGRDYGFKDSYENIKLKLTFGVYWDAYESYNILAKHLKGNKAIIEYDWGQGIRYADVRVSSIPKTEKGDGGLLESDIIFYRNRPFYERVIDDPDEPRNNSFLPTDVNITLWGITDPEEVIIKLKTPEDEYYFYVYFNGFETLSPIPTKVFIDAENKKVYDEYGRNLYGFTASYLTPFLRLPPDEDDELGLEVDYIDGVEKVFFNYKLGRAD